MQQTEVTSTPAVLTNPTRSRYHFPHTCKTGRDGGRVDLMCRGHELAVCLTLFPRHSSKLEASTQAIRKHRAQVIVHTAAPQQQAHSSPASVLSASVLRIALTPAVHLFSHNTELDPPKHPLESPFSFSLLHRPDAHTRSPVLSIPKSRVLVVHLEYRRQKAQAKMLLQRLRQSTATARTATTAKRRRPPPPLVARALSSTAALDAILRSVASTSSPSPSSSPSSSTTSPSWRPEEPREACMLPQPQYDGDWEIQAEEEEQQQQRRVAGRRGGEEEEEEEVDDEEDAWEAEGHLRRLRPHLSLNFAAAAATSNANGSCRNIHPHTGHTAEEDTVRRRLGQPSLRCPALVLNQDLTPLTLFPLTIAPWWSAVRSTLRGRVSVLENYDRRVRSTHALHQLPSVVALTRQQTPSHNYKHFGASASSSSCNGVEGEVRVVEEDVLPASRIPKPFRRNVALRDGYVCCFCGRRLSYRTLTLDHVTPKCRGGEDSWENLASACMQCNSRKGSLRVSELGQINMRLLRAPYAPTALQVCVF